MTFLMPSAILALLGLLPRWLALHTCSMKEAIEILRFTRRTGESLPPDTSPFPSLTPFDPKRPSAR